MSSSLTLRIGLAAAALVAILVASSCTTRTTTKSAPTLGALEYSADQSALASLDREIADAGKDPAQLGPIAARLIATLRQPATTPAARQAICERLAVFPAAVLLEGENATFFAAMLADRDRSNLARLALDQVPGAEVDELYVRALAAAEAPAQRAVVQSLGYRRAPTAVAPLARLLDASDGELADAAVVALGRIATPAALDALHQAPNPAAPGVLAARLAIAQRFDGPAAADEFHRLEALTGAPAHFRAAATRGLLFAAPEAASDRIVAAIESGDPVLRATVIEAIAAHPSKRIAPTLADRLAVWDPATQEAVIAALGRRGDPAAIAAIAAATRHADASVRAAAIVALGRLPGSPETARLLAGIAAGDNSTDTKLAHNSLAQLNGAGVADAVTDGATSGEPALRPVFLEQIAARHMTEALPLLLAARTDSAPAVRAAALGSLADLAPATSQPAILDWALAASHPTEQSRAIRALANVTLRNPDVNARAQPIVAAIEQAPAAVAVRLLPVLPRIGGAVAADGAARLALHEDPAVADAAASTLSRWSDALGLPALLQVAEKTQREQTRGIAVRGAIGLLDRARDLPAAEVTSSVARLLPVAPGDEARGRLVYLLSRCDSDEALALAEKLTADATVAAVARDAVLGIRAHRAGPPVSKATANGDDAPNLFDGNLKTRWAAPATLGQSITVDFHSTRPFRQVVLDNGTSSWGAPDEVQILVTDDLANPGEARASAPGRLGKITLNLPPDTRGRYLIVRHSVDSPDDWWGMGELVID